MSLINNIKYYKKGRYDVMEAYNATWLKIFDHNSTGSRFFHPSEVKYKTNDTNMYSILKLIPYICRYDEKYEFIIEYPEYHGYNRWSQTTNPLESNSSSEIGFNPITLTWKSDRFSGLTLSNSQLTYLDASNNIFWYYAIGAYHSYMNENSFPGPCDGNQGIVVQKVLLYIRIKDINHLFQYSHVRKHPYRPVKLFPVLI